MDDDLMAALRGQASKPAAKAKAYDPEDALIRTVKFESSGNPDESRAIASVITNRAKLSGKKYDQVVQEPGQFEPWQKRRKDIDAFTPDNPEYQALKAQLTDVLAGKPTTDATHFYAPEAQADLAKKDGRPAVPDWDDGTGTDIGKTRFIKGKYGDQQAAPVDSDLMAALRGEDEKGSIPLAEASAGATTSAKPGQTVTKAQETTFTKLQKTLDQNAAKGSVKNPYAQVVDGEVPEEPGAYYVDMQGALKRTPGGDTYREDIKAALDAGDQQKAAELTRKHGDEVQDAFSNRFVSGALMGGKNEAGAIIRHPLDFVTKGGLDAPSIQATIRDSDAKDAIQHARHPIASDAGSITGALTGGLAASALTGGGADLPMLAKLGFSAGEGAAVGGAQGFLGASGTTAERLPEAKEGAKFGALLGPAGEIAGEAGHFVGKKILGLAVSKEAAELAKKAKDDYGIELRGGQIANSQFVKFFDSVLNRTPGTGYAAKSAEQSSAFTRAVAKTFGEKADGLTPEVMARAKTRIGNEFDRVGAATTIRDVDVLQTKLGETVADAQKVLPESEVKPLLNQVEQIASAIQTDQHGIRTLSGESYQALTRRGTPLDRLTQSGNPNVAHYAQALKDELLNAVERNASVDDVKALKTARKQWAKMKTLEPLAEKAGPEGEISPALLLQALRSNYDNLAYDGGGDLGDLSKIGQRFLKEPSSSGTAERLFAQKILGGAGLAAGGGGALWLAQHPEEAGKLGLGAGALALGTLAAAKGGAVVLDNPVYRKMLLRSANKAPAVVGKGARPILTAPRLAGPATAAQLSNRFVSEPASQ